MLYISYNTIKVGKVHILQNTMDTYSRVYLVIGLYLSLQSNEIWRHCYMIIDLHTIGSVFVEVLVFGVIYLFTAHIKCSGSNWGNHVHNLEILRLGDDLLSSHLDHNSSDHSSHYQSPLSRLEPGFTVCQASMLPTGSPREMVFNGKVSLLFLDKRNTIL